MPNFIFQGTQAVGVEDDKPVRLTFSPPNLPGIANLEDEFWITDMQGGIEPNFQILYAFSNNIYVNAFTPRLTNFVLEGIYIPSNLECGETNTPENSSQTQPAFMQMYWEYNIVDANADPDNQKLLTVSFNQIVIRGFLIKAHIQRYNKGLIDGHAFKLHLLGFMETGKVNESDVQDKKAEAARNNPASAETSVAQTLSNARNVSSIAFSTPVPGLSPQAISSFERSFLRASVRL
jgi:hypothetical protein